MNRKGNLRSINTLPPLPDVEVLIQFWLKYNFFGFWISG